MASSIGCSFDFDNSTVLRTTVTNSAQRGIQLILGSYSNTVGSNTITGYGICGIETHAADNNTITNNRSASVLLPGRPLLRAPDRDLHDDRRILVWRRPENPVAWLLLLFGSVMALGSLDRSYALQGLVESPGSLPGAMTAAWLLVWAMPLFFGVLTSVFLHHAAPLRSVRQAHQAAKTGGSPS